MTLVSIIAMVFELAGPGKDFEVYSEAVLNERNNRQEESINDEPSSND
jgi:hypothetical protein